MADKLCSALPMYYRSALQFWTYSTLVLKMPLIFRFCNMDDVVLCKYERQYDPPSVGPRTGSSPTRPSTPTGVQAAGNDSREPALQRGTGPQLRGTAWGVPPRRPPLSPCPSAAVSPCLWDPPRCPAGRSGWRRWCGWAAPTASTCSGCSAWCTT